MTDKDKIKEEIENQRNGYNKIWEITHSDDLESHIAYANKSLLDRLIQFIDSLPEEHNEDLEEAAKQHSKQTFNGLLIEDNIDAFIAGAEWQKHQMMKDAVDATIFSELKGNDGSLFQVKSDRFRMNGVKISDKIKVIPIKIEQQ